MLDWKLCQLHMYIYIYIHITIHIIVTHVGCVCLYMLVCWRGHLAWMLITTLKVWPIDNYIYIYTCTPFFWEPIRGHKEKQMTQISSRLVNNMQSPPVLFSRIPPLFLDENVQSDRWNNATDGRKINRWTCGSWETLLNLRGSKQHCNIIYPDCGSFMAISIHP